MKTLLATLLFAGGAVCAGIIEEIPFDSSKPIKVRTHTNATSTLVFPYPIEVALGAGFLSEDAYSKLVATEDGAEGWAIDYVFFHQGEKVITLHPVHDQIGYRNLNITCNGELIVVEPELVSDVSIAHTKIVALEKAVIEAREIAKKTEIEKKAKEKQAKEQGADKRHVSGSGGQAGSSEAPNVEIAKTATPLAIEGTDRATIPQLMGVLKLTQLASIMNNAELQELKQQTGYLAFDRKNRRAVYDGYEVSLYMAVRSNDIDAIGFFGVITNTSDRPIQVDSSSWYARSGAYLLRRVVSDKTPVIEPAGSEPFWFVAYRTDSDTRNNTSEISNFSVGVSLL